MDVLDIIGCFYLLGDGVWAVDPHSNCIASCHGAKEIVDDVWTNAHRL